LDGTIFGVAVNSGIWKEGGVNASGIDLLAFLAPNLVELRFGVLHPSFASTATAAGITNRKGRQIISCNIIEDCSTLGSDSKAKNMMIDCVEI